MLSLSNLKKYGPSSLKMVRYISEPVIKYTYQTFNLLKTLGLSNGIYSISTDIKVQSIENNPQLTYSQLQAIQDIQKKYVAEIAKIFPYSDISFVVKDPMSTSGGNFEIGDSMMGVNQNPGSWSE